VGPGAAARRDEFGEDRRVAAEIRLLGALLFHVSFTDPLIYGADVLGLVNTGLVARLSAPPGTRCVWTQENISKTPRQAA